jgi:arylsulfatase
MKDLKKQIVVLSLTLFACTVFAQDKPNIVFVFMDNFGYGELGIYGGGITRGGATPRIDALAAEGIRLTNFNVEAQCTPSRAALMTGRYAIRSGNASVPITTGMYGLTQWEITMAEMLSDEGYVTGMFGKWHLGHTAGRFPTDQGFDEWYGIPNSTDESLWPDQAQFNSVVEENLSPYAVPEYIYDGRKGKEPEKVKVYDSEMRPEIDRELTDKAIDFMQRQVAADEPFFVYLPYTQTHMPVVPSKEFAGKSGNGDWGDVLMQIDAYVSDLLDTIDELGISDNTIFVFTSDNGPEMLPGHNGWGGPWRGSYFTGLEGSLRVPFIMRWPGKVPAGRVSNEIVHALDMFATFASVAGADVPDDRVIDSVDQLDFLTGRQDKSNRDGFIVYVGSELFGIKWRNWKMMFQEVERGTDERRIFDFPRFFNLYSDPKEEYPLTKATAGHFWVRWPMGELLTEHGASLQKEPPIRPGTPDPYKPKRRSSQSCRARHILESIALRLILTSCRQGDTSMCEQTVSETTLSRERVIPSQSDPLPCLGYRWPRYRNTYSARSRRQVYCPASRRSSAAKPRRRISECAGKGPCNSPSHHPRCRRRPGSDPRCLPRREFVVWTPAERRRPRR